jgi:uncharacterized repeat protein (TIGR02543 family)
MKKFMNVLLVFAVLALVGCTQPQAPAAKYKVTYNANGGSGTAPTDVAEYVAGGTVTVAAGTVLTRPEFAFAGWNTAASGSGTSYAAGVSLTMGAADATLYAQWTDRIIGTWSSNYVLAGTYINVKDVTTITATTFSTARTLTWTATAPTVLAALGVNATTQTALGIAASSTVTGAQLDAIGQTTYKNLFGFTGVTAACSQVIVSGTYTRVIGSAQFALTDNTKNNSAAQTAAAATAGAGEVVAVSAITYTGYFTRLMTFSTLGDTAGTPAAAVSATNPKAQNWMSYFGADGTTAVFYDGGTVMPVTKLP